MIRKAHNRDKKQASELYYISGPNICNYCFASDEKTTLKLIEMLFQKPANSFSHECYWLYEEDERIKGAAVVFPGKDEALLENNIGRYSKEMLKIAGYKRCISMMLRSRTFHKFAPCAEADEFYIQSLAVFPEFRGQGIGSALLNHIIAHAKDNSYKKVSLIAESDNEHAIMIYKKLGFVITEEVTLPGKFQKFYLAGFKKMVLNL